MWKYGNQPSQRTIIQSTQQPNFIMFSALPLLEIIILYTAIIYRIWMQKKCQGNATTANQQVEFKAKENFPQMLIIVVLIFSLYWLPIKVYTMIELYSSSFCLNSTLHFLVLFLSIVNCAINPLIYIAFVVKS